MTKLPSPLGKGAKIGVFNPSEALTDHRKEYVKLGASILRELEYTIEFPSNQIFTSWGETRNSLSRAHEFTQSVLNSNTQAIISAWAGSRSADIVPLINFQTIAKKPKPIIGYGDNCIFLNEISLRTGMVTYYGPNYLGKLNLMDRNALRRSMDSIGQCISLDLRVQDSSLTGNEVRGQLLGGSLRSFWRYYSTKNTLIANNHPIILCLETASQRIDELEKMIKEVSQTPLRSLIVGVIMGKTSLCNPTEVIEVLSRYLGKSVTLVKCDDFGHGGRVNPALPIGAWMSLSSDGTRLQMVDVCG